MSSALSFTFRPSLIPAQYQVEFISRFAQLVLDYETLTALPPASPDADSVPPPSSFAPVQGDGADGETVPPTVKKARKNPWADLSEDQRAERLAAMKRGRAAKAAERRVSADSLDAPAPTEATPAPESAPAPAPADDAVSDTSSAKKARKNPWADLTPEQRAAKIAAMRAGREAKKAAASSAVDTGSA